MESRRQKKISGVIHKEISDIFQKNGPNYYGNAFVTVTKATVTPDLQVARIYLSIYNEKEKQQIIEQIEQHNKEIRYQLGNRVRHQLRKVPELEFFLDETLDYVYKMEKIFKNIHEKEDQEGDEKE